MSYSAYSSVRNRTYSSGVSYRSLRINSNSGSTVGRNGYSGGVTAGTRRVGTSFGTTYAPGYVTHGQTFQGPAFRSAVGYTQGYGPDQQWGGSNNGLYGGGAYHR